MALIVPTDPLPLFFPWDAFVPDTNADDWENLFAAAGRRSQNVTLYDGIEVENGAGDSLLRRYAALVMTGPDRAVKGAVQNLTEFKRGGVINVAMNQANKIGLIWQTRCFIAQENMPAYRAIWDDCSKLFEDDTKTVRLDEGDRLDQYIDFLKRVAPLVGTKRSLELSRGYGEVTVSQADTARNEAEEELMVRCVERFELALMGEDGAQNPALNSYCFVRMDVQGPPRKKPDFWERVAGKAQWLTMSELAQAFLDGHILDPYTLTALQVLQFKRPDLYATIAA